MKVERLAKLVQKPAVHQKVLGSYRGAYALGVTHSSVQQEAALSLSVEGADADQFPQEIELEGEHVQVLVQTEWHPPRPL